MRFIVWILLINLHRDLFFLYSLWLLFYNLRSILWSIVNNFFLMNSIAINYFLFFFIFALIGILLLVIKFTLLNLIITLTFEFLSLKFLHHLHLLLDMIIINHWYLVVIRMAKCFNPHLLFLSNYFIFLMNTVQYALYDSLNII